MSDSNNYGYGHGNNDGTGYGSGCGLLYPYAGVDTGIIGSDWSIVFETNNLYMLKFGHGNGDVSGAGSIMGEGDAYIEEKFTNRLLDKLKYKTAKELLLIKIGYEV